MPVADLPPSAQAMYKTWWRTIQGWASQIEPGTSRFDAYSDVAAAAAAVNREYPGVFQGYSPAGVSSLLSQAFAINDARDALTAAPDSQTDFTGLVARPPWSKSDAEMAAYPVWQVRSEITYTTAEGIQETGVFTSKLEFTLPPSVGALRTIVEYQVASTLASPPVLNYPRTGTLDSVDSITLLAI